MQTTYRWRNTFMADVKLRQTADQKDEKDAQPEPLRLGIAQVQRTRDFLSHHIGTETGMGQTFFSGARTFNLVALSTKTISDFLVTLSKGIIRFLDKACSLAKHRE